MFHDKTRKTWRVQWTTPDGKRRSKSFGSKADAKLFEAMMEKGAVPNEAVALTFSEFADKWHEDYCKKEKAQSQWVNDESTIRIHMKPSLGHLQLSELTPVLLERYRVELRSRKHPKTGKPLSVKTVNLVIGLLRGMLVTAKRWGHINVNPAADLRLYPQPDQTFDYWTAEERDFFWRFARHVDRDFARTVVLACHTGMRRGELAALKRYQIDFDRMIISVDSSYCFKTGTRIATTKNKRVGFVPINADTLIALEEARLLPPDANVFDRNLLLHASQRLRRLCKKIGARPVRYHDLRHSYASAMATVGIADFARQTLMRHRSASQTQRYSHLAPSTLHEALRLIESQDARALAREHTREGENVSEFREIRGAVDRI